MAVRFTLAFVTAAWITLLGCAELRRRARRWGRQPARAEQLRRLGGAVVAVATLVGIAFAPSISGELAVVVGIAGALCLLAVIGAHRAPGRAQLAVVVVAAGSVVAAGVRAAPLDSPGLDAILTVVWIAAVTSAFLRLDHADGLATAVGVVAAFGVFVIAAPGDPALATLVIALTGSGAALFVFSVRPASLALGPGGAAFIGFVVAVATVELEPTGSGTNSLLVPALLAGLPLLDLVMSAGSRLWVGLPASHSRRDHLVHRITKRGLTSDQAIWALIGAQAVLTLVAVLVGRDVLAPAVGLAAGAAVLVILLTRTVGAGPARTDRRPPDRARLVTSAAVIVGVLVALGAVAVVDALRQLREAETALNSALDAGRAGDSDAARQEFAEAADAFERADARLAPIAWVGSAIPVLSDNARAAHELASSGAEVARAGEHLAQAGGERLQVVGGVMNVEELRRLTPEIESAATLVQDTADRIDDLRRPYLVAPVADRVDEAYDELSQASDEAEKAVAAARLAPAIFGADGARQYFLAAQNNAELRATGGIIGNWGVLTADDGEVSLDDFERTRLLNEDPPLPDSPRRLDAPPEYVDRYGRFDPARIWQNINMSPDFPTVGSVIERQFPQSGGGPIDGVVAVDPLGLQALLELTGPVTVEAWPAPITAENVIDVTLKQQYDAFPREEREEFLGDVTEAVWDRALEVDLGTPSEIADTLGEAGHRGHLMVWLARPEEQALAESLGIAGELPPVASDSLLVVNQNAAANKVDYYLTRQVEYDVQLAPDPGGATGEVEATLAVQLENAAPAGPPSVALGPFLPGFQAGENRSFVSIYTPLSFEGATLDGMPTGLETATELNRNVYSAFVSIAPGSSRELALRLDGPVELDDDGWYTLDLVRQPTLRPDEVDVSVEVPDGWRIVDVEGLDLVTPRRAVSQVDLDENRQARVRVAPDPSA